MNKRDFKPEIRTTTTTVDLTTKKTKYRETLGPYQLWACQVSQSEYVCFCGCCGGGTLVLDRTGPDRTSLS